MKPSAILRMAARAAERDDEVMGALRIEGAMGTDLGAGWSKTSQQLIATFGRAGDPFDGVSLLVDLRNARDPQGVEATMFAFAAAIAESEGR